MFSNEINKVIKNVNRRSLRNNTQRTLVALLSAKTDWVPRSALRIPSVGARLRDLRKSEFGNFKIECTSATKAGIKTRKSTSVKRQTYYRISPDSVTLSKVTKVLGKAILNVSSVKKAAVTNTRKTK